jgi:hypothetical protein
MPEDATFVGAKKLFTKESTILNFALAHVAYKNLRCINFNILMYLQDNIFNVTLGSNLRSTNLYFI